ncbi:unnamed protein product [Amoebophrya sp. A120]|nr:unnamed protein product [Amoebophrya sp. A120]|eukprot:GSA120T00021343001.1
MRTTSVVEEAFLHGPIFDDEALFETDLANVALLGEIETGLEQVEVDPHDEASNKQDAGPGSVTSRSTSSSTKEPLVHQEILNTSPLTPMSHWRQVLFFLDHGPARASLALPEKTLIRGSFSLRKFYENNYRDLVIDIEYEVSGVEVEKLEEDVVRKRSQQFFLR